MMKSKKKRVSEEIIKKTKAIRKKVKNAESTISKSYKIDTYILEDLAKVLNDVYCLFRPVSADYDSRKALVNGLNVMAKEMFGDSEESSPVLEAYGSFAMDMFSRHSDLDLSINFANKTSELCRDEKLKILRRFAERLSSLERQGFVRNVESIFSARVPIVKFFDQRAAVECDLSVENKGGILNSEIIRIISQIDERFQKLCLLVKLWAKAQEVNSALYGTLNSLSITLLVAFHLQTQKPPILPPFSVLFKDGINPPEVEKIAENFVNWGQRNKESLGRLFATFFIKLQSVEFLWRQGLCNSVLNGLWIYKKWKTVGRGFICVEDFTDVSENVARRVSEDGNKRIYSSINRTVNDIFEFLNGEVSETYFRCRLFGEQAVVKRHPPVPPLNGEIPGTHLNHSLISQQVVPEPPPVLLHNGNVTEIDCRQRLFGKQAVMEPPPPVPQFTDKIAGTHLRHGVFGQPAAMERPPPVPRFDDNITGTHLRHGVFGELATMDPRLPVPRFDDNIAGTQLRHGLFGQPAAMERPPPGSWFDNNIAGSHLRHGVFGEPAAMEGPPHVPRFNDEISGTHMRHDLFGQPAPVELPLSVPSSLNVYPQEPHNNYRNGFSRPPEVHYNKRVCLENGYRTVDRIDHRSEEDRRYEDLRNRYAGNYNTFEEYNEVPRFGIHNNHSGDLYRQAPLNGGVNGHLVHHRHDGRLSGEEQMHVGHWLDYSRRTGPPPPPPPPPPPRSPPYDRAPYESSGPPKFREPPYISRPRFTRKGFAKLG